MARPTHRSYQVESELKDLERLGWSVTHHGDKFIITCKCKDKKPQLRLVINDASLYSVAGRQMKDLRRDHRAHHPSA